MEGLPGGGVGGKGPWLVRGALPTSVGRSPSAPRAEVARPEVVAAAAGLAVSPRLLQRAQGCCTSASQLGPFPGVPGAHIALGCPLHPRVLTSPWGPASSWVLGPYITAGCLCPCWV